VNADGTRLDAVSQPIGWFGLRVHGLLALSLHSSNELGELSQRLWSRQQQHKCRSFYCHYTANLGEVQLIDIKRFVVVQRQHSVVELLNEQKHNK